MSRKVGTPVRVTESDNGRPLSFYWPDRWNQVSGIIDSWRESGEWWDGAEEMDYYLVSAGNGCYELCKEASGQWELSRIID